MTANYAVCETAVVAGLRTLTTYFAVSGQVGVKDYSAESKGYLCWAVIRPGAVGYGAAKSGPKERAWGMILELFYAWRGDLVTSLTAFETMRGAVLDYIDNNPNLLIYPATSGVSGVRETLITSDSDPMGYAPDGKSQIAVMQSFRVTVYQS